MLVLLRPLLVCAQQEQSPSVAPFLLDSTRLESWAFFDPPAGGGDPTYTLLGNRATLGVRINSRRFDAEASFQSAQLIGLPRRAAGPGPLGPGALYYESARNRGAYQVYFKSVSMRVHDFAPGVSVAVGRMAYVSNPESPRLAGRLIGNAEWTTSERAFDGARLDYISPAWRAHASFVMPTQGAYEESANPTIGQVRLATVSFSARDLTLFGHHYRDHRPIRVRPDNSGRIPSRVAIRVGTVGLSHVRAYELGPGQADSVLWAATQFGDWFGQLHHAFSGIAEVGYNWRRTTWQPQVRVGLVHASGDDAPSDSVHRTFFPMVPTTRPDLLAGTYAQMNLRDMLVEGRFQPHARVRVGAELHRLSLVNARDRWYSGTGATAFRGNYFGYSSRPSRLVTDLGTFVQFSAEATMTKWWTVKASVGWFNGGEVVRRQFTGDRLTVLAVENRLVFR